jgi:hypothetical protein
VLGEISMAIRLRTTPITMTFNDGTEKIDLGVWGPSNAKINYEKAIASLDPSPKAKKILKTAEDAADVVYVLVTDSYFPKYFSPLELQKRYSVVLPDNASLITWDPKSDQPVKTINAHKPKFLDYITMQDSQKVEMMRPFMILLHEFGHFMQYLTLPQVYEIQRERTYVEGAKGIRTIDDAIEDENVQHHEAPVAYELGQPIRFKYWDQS